MTSPELQTRWSWKRIAGYSAIVAVLWVIAQVGALLAVLLLRLILQRGFDVEQWAERADTDGVFVSAAIFSAAALCIPTLRFLVGRCEPRPWHFLGVRAVAGRDIALACAAMVVFVVVADAINVWLFERPLVPPFLRDTYATSGEPAVLFLTIVLVAPFSEELVMRGFLFGALSSRGIATAWTIALTSALFTLLHTQYDVHDMVAVLLIAVILGIARARLDSIVPTIAMHATSNALAFFETMWMMRS